MAVWIGVCAFCGMTYWHDDSEAIVKMAMLSHVSRSRACAVSRPSDIDAMVRVAI